MFENLIKKLKGKDSYTLEEYLTKDENGITFLENLLKANELISEKERNKLKKSVEAQSIFIKYNKNLHFEILGEKELFKKINDKPIIEYFIMHNHSDTKIMLSRITKNTDIIDLIIKYEKWELLNSLSNNILRKLIKEDKKGAIIEKYFDNEEAIERLISLNKSTKKLFDICKKNNRIDLLKYCNINSLTAPLLISGQAVILFDYLMSNNIIPQEIYYFLPCEKDYAEYTFAEKDFIKFLAKRGLFEYLKFKNEDTLINTKVNGKTLLELLIEKELFESVNIIYNKKTIEILYKNNKLSKKHIDYISSELLRTECKKFNIDSDNELSGYMFNKREIIPVCPGLEERKKEEIERRKKINNLYKQKKYSEMTFYLREKELLNKVEGNITLIEKLIEENIDFYFKFAITSQEIIDIILKKNRLDILVYVKLEKLLESINENKTYLDYMIELIKNNEINIDLDKIKLDYQNCSVYDKAAFYLKLAQNDMVHHVNKISKDELFKIYIETDLFTELLKQNKEITFSKIFKNENLSEDAKRDPKIAVILKAKGENVENINIPLHNTNFNDEFLNKKYKENDIKKLQESDEYLLNKLKELFLNDEKSDKELIEVLIIGYKQALVNNHDLFIKEIEKLIEIKEKNPNFRYLKQKESDFFRSSTESVHCNNSNIDTLMHETGHVFHYYATNFAFPNTFVKIIEKLKNDPEILKKTQKLSEEYNIIKNEITKIVEEEYKDYFQKYYTTEVNNEIELFLQKSIEEKKDEYKSLGIDEEDLDIILNETFTKEEYIKTQKRLFVEEFTYDILDEKYGYIINVCDILDGIYEGKLCDSKLYDKNGKVIKGTPGHGEKYYSNKLENIFTEMIANFSAIIKSSNINDGLKLLSNTVGHELYNLISDYYYNDILEINKKNPKKRKGGNV